MRSKRSAARRRGPRPTGDAPTIVIETRHDRVNGVARILVADNGPGIPAADRDKLFMPYYSTKRRGSGLGLAIVRRIIAEHGGSIEAADNVPTGTVFTIESAGVRRQSGDDDWLIRLADLLWSDES